MLISDTAFQCVHVCVRLMPSPAEDGQEWSLWLLQGHSKVVQLLLHQEACSFLRQIHSDHRAVKYQYQYECINYKDP